MEAQHCHRARPARRSRAHQHTHCQRAQRATRRKRSEYVRAAEEARRLGLPEARAARYASLSAAMQHMEDEAEEASSEEHPQAWDAGRYGLWQQELEDLRREAELRRQGVLL